MYSVLLCCGMDWIWCIEKYRKVPNRGLQFTPLTYSQISLKQTWLRAEKMVVLQYSHTSPYKHSCHASQPLGGERRHHGRQGGHLCTSSGPPLDLPEQLGGLSKRTPASTSHPVALGWKLILCFWRRNCAGIRLAVRVEADSVLLKEKLCRHQVGC